MAVGTGESPLASGSALAAPWKRLTFHNSLAELGGLQPEEYEIYENALALARRLGENVPDGEPLGKIQARLFDTLVEPKLIQPHFIYHYPTDISPLSRMNDEDSSLTDRFELFICGHEMSNAFSELNPRDKRIEIGLTYIYGIGLSTAKEILAKAGIDPDT